MNAGRSPLYGMSTRLLCLALGTLVAAAGCRHVQAPAGNGPAAAEDVNIGYGTRGSGNVTGAVSSLNVEDMDQAEVASMERLLRGRVPGLQVIRRPGGEVVLRVRGMTTASGSAGPHVVIDGMASNARDLLGLPPEVVSRIDVLKDASAAVYGLRGANGVILVTTRRGR
jgi:TonB-dependent starch-binding outer membrane protein SusC